MAFVVFLLLWLSLVQFKHKPFSSCKVHVPLQLQPWLWRCVCWWVTHVFEGLSACFCPQDGDSSSSKCLCLSTRLCGMTFITKRNIKLLSIALQNIVCFTHALASMASCVFWVFRPYGIYCSGYMTVFWDTQWSIWSKHCTTSWKVAGPITDRRHCNSSLTWPVQLHCDSGVDSASNRNEYQEYVLGDKGGWCVRLTTLPLSCASCLELLGASTSWSPWACAGLYTDSFTFTYMTVFSSLQTAANIGACLHTFTSSETVTLKGIQSL